MAKGAAVLDLKEKYEVVSVVEEKNGIGIEKHCLKSDCSTFGLISEKTDVFVLRHPDFQIKKRGVIIGGVKMDIVERIGFLKDEECAICLHRFDYISKNFCSTSCGHSFHLDCLFTYMQRGQNCPICRTDLGFQCKKMEVVPEILVPVRRGDFPPDWGDPLEDLPIVDLPEGDENEEKEENDEKEEEIPVHHIRHLSSRLEYINRRLPQQVDVLRQLNREPQNRRRSL
jgi:Ring finger domain